MNIKRTILD